MSGKPFVIVLGSDGHPVMPCTGKRARLLLERGRAKVKQAKPFTIQLKDRSSAECTLQTIEQINAARLAKKLDKELKMQELVQSKVGVSLNPIKHSNPTHPAEARRKTDVNKASWVPVLASTGQPLMPCHPARARELVRKGLATKSYLKGVFHIKLTQRSKGDTQVVALGVDPGSKTPT